MDVQDYHYYPEAGRSYTHPSASASSPARYQKQQSLHMHGWDFYGSNPNVSPSGSSIDTPVSDAPAALSYPLIAGEQAVAPEYPAATYAEQQSWHTPPLAPVVLSKNSLSDALGSFSYEHAPQPSHITSQDAGYYSGHQQYHNASYPPQLQQEQTMAVSHTIPHIPANTLADAPSHHPYTQMHPTHHGYSTQQQMPHHPPPVHQQGQQPAYLPANPSQSHPYSGAHTQQLYAASMYSHAHVPPALPQGHAAQEYRATQSAAVLQTPLYHPKPQHPLPEWTKQPELVSGPGLTPGHVASAPAPARVDVSGAQQQYHLQYSVPAPFQFGQVASTGQDQEEEEEDDEMDDDDGYDDEYENEAPEVRQERSVPVQTGSSSLSSSSLLFQPISAAVQSRFAPKSSTTSSAPAVPTAAPNVPAPTSQTQQQYPMLPLGMSAPAYWA